MIDRRLLAIAVSACLALTAACGGDGDTSTSSRTVAAGSPAPTVGIGELDQLIRAAYATDQIELAALTGYFETPCASTSLGNGSSQPPPCRENETDGQSVQVLPSSTCDDGWVRPEQAPDAYGAAFPDGAVNLHAIYVPQVSLTTFGGGFGATHVLVFDTGEEGGQGAALWADGGRIVWLRGICDSFDDLLDPADISSFLIEPPGGAPGAETPAASDTATPAAAPTPGAPQ